MFLFISHGITIAPSLAPLPCLYRAHPTQITGTAAFSLIFISILPSSPPRLQLHRRYLHLGAVPGRRSGKPQLRARGGHPESRPQPHPGQGAHLPVRGAPDAGQIVECMWHL